MKGYAFQIDGKTPGQEMRASVEYALSWFWSRFHERPSVVYVHPETARRYSAVHGDWPGNWPRLVENDKMNRQMIVLEPSNGGQLRLL